MALFQQVAEVGTCQSQQNLRLKTNGRIISFALNEPTDSCVLNHLFHVLAFKRYHETSH